MENKKKLYIIICSVAAVVIIAVILCAVLLPRSSRSSDDSTSDSNSGTTEDMLVVENPSDSDAPGTTAPEVTDNRASTDETTPEVTPGETVEITPPEETDRNDKQTQPSEKPVTTEKAETATPPVVTNPPPEDSGSSGGIVIGGGQSGAYSCGVAGHHCEGAETHTYITNLELEGCKYCGSHSCASFYAQDEWGNACYTPSKCPQYDIKKDPVYYCQECGRKCGDGSNGTCVQFVVADNCPNCGEHVAAWTCHTCK